MAFLTDLSLGALNQEMKASLVTKFVVYIPKIGGATRRLRGCIRRSFGDEFRRTQAGRGSSGDGRSVACVGGAQL